MGNNFFDQYSLLHFATGVIAYFFEMSFFTWFLLHMLFEIIENTSYGVKFINTWLKNIWPGGKPYADSYINSIGDQVFSMLGWLVAYQLDKLNNKYQWYSLNNN